MDVGGRVTTAVGKVTADRVTEAPLSITTCHRTDARRKQHRSGFSTEHGFSLNCRLRWPNVVIFFYKRHRDEKRGAHIKRKTRTENKHKRRSNGKILRNLTCCIFCSIKRNSDVSWIIYLTNTILRNFRQMKFTFLRVL